MKLLVVLFAVICATQAVSLLECVSTVLETVERSVGKVNGFRDWQDRVEATVGVFDDQRDACGTIEDFREETRCHLNNMRRFYQDMRVLGDELQGMAGGSLEIRNDFIEGMRNCVS